jgi:NET1-associated nuclear protein 1 (U3 small nucleolar RNA-associated protein 17)
MAPALKRKRTSAAADALTNGTPIAVLEESPAAATESAFDIAWEVAGKPSKELVPVNGTNGYFTDEETTTTRPDNVHSIIRKSQTRKGSSHVHERIEQSWKASQSIGGRLIEIDPVFTTDEK